MQYLDFLAQVHDHLKPRSYLEIGVHHGRSMALSTAPSIGIDPDHAIADGVTIGPHVTLHRSTVEDFFTAENPLSAFAEPVADLAFITRQHLYELVLQDFIAVEQHTGPGGVVIIDDVLPRAVTEAARQRTTRAWAGDAWKIIPSLRAVRPDLILLLVRTTPTGLLLVLGADLTNADLVAAREHLLAEHAGSDAEPPAEIITRSTAVYPTWVVGAPFWEVLRSQRERGVTPAEGRAELLAGLQAWTSTKLNDKQAKAIHPSLTGKPRAAKPAKKAASARPTSTRPGSGTGGRAGAGQNARRVLNGVRRRLKKLVRVSRRAVTDRRKES